MASGPWLFTNTTRTKILDGTFASGGSWKVALFLSTSNLSASSTTYAGLTNEHANANGYTTGGVAITALLAGTTSVTWSFHPTPGNPIWTATGGNIVAKWGVLYEVSGDVFAYYLLDSGGANVTATAGNTLTVDSDGTPGPVLTLA